MGAAPEAARATAWRRRDGRAQPSAEQRDKLPATRRSSPRSGSLAEKMRDFAPNLPGAKATDSKTYDAMAAVRKEMFE